MYRRKWKFLLYIRCSSNNNNYNCCFSLENNIYVNILFFIHEKLLN